MATFKRTLSQRTLILCEGESEEFYFKSAKKGIGDKIRRQGIDIQIETAKHQDCEGLVEEALAKAKKAKGDLVPYQTIWVVFDNDRQEIKKQGSLSRAFQLAKGKVNIVYSSIAWEFWYLLHFGYTTRAFANSAEVIDELKKQEGFADYKKPYDKAFEKLKSRLSTGVLHAQKLRKSQNEIGGDRPIINPWADADELLKHLGAM
jgi:hypothetical protein